MNWPKCSRRTTRPERLAPLCIFIATEGTVKVRSFVFDANMCQWNLSAFNNLMPICVIGT